MQSPTWTCMILMMMMMIVMLAKPGASDPRTSEAKLYCGQGRPPTGTNFIPTFVAEMESLSNVLNRTHFATHTVKSNPPMYGLVQCHSDLSRTDCLLCFAAARTALPKCLPATSARIFLDGCFLRYDTYSFFNETLDGELDAVECDVAENGVDFGSALDRAVNESVGEGFGALGYKGVYVLGQCWRSVDRTGCRDCLAAAEKALLDTCRGRREGRALFAGCYLRFSHHKFYNHKLESYGDDDGDGAKSSSRRRVIIAIGLGGLAFFMLSLFGAYAIYSRVKKSREVRKNLGEVSRSINKSGLNFKYETLEKATNYFSASKKIGQGGAGSVYKGTLPSGEIVAVKRLTFNTRQWVDEFFNEVNLISGIQHKNLVKLLGCSIEGPESLLVYEYVPNRSLDQFLFEKSKVQILNWKQRFHIVVGTAEGLAYLHGGSKLRIIHRDIKSSNVLLDEDLTPKIADFGLVRCFGPDKTHLSTGIAGTLGYMAPEYLVRGQLTDKSDVYSFGVLVLEIVCGRRNCAFTQDSGSLLQTVWKLYKSDKLSEAVDPCLRGNFPENDVSNVLKIGLLCTQASVSLRPSMAEVVSMLTNKEKDIPNPKQPPFLNATVLDPASSTRSYSSQSCVSNKALTQVGGSYTSTEISSSNSSDGPARV